MHRSTHNTPRWLKLFGIAMIVLLLMAVGLHLAGRSLLERAFGASGGDAPAIMEHGPRQP